MTKVPQPQEHIQRCATSLIIKPFFFFFLFFFFKERPKKGTAMREKTCSKLLFKTIRSVNIRIPYYIYLYVYKNFVKRVHTRVHIYAVSIVRLAVLVHTISHAMSWDFFLNVYIMLGLFKYLHFLFFFALESNSNLTSL